MWASKRKEVRDHQQPRVSRMLRVDLGVETRMGRALWREDPDCMERDLFGPRNGAVALGLQRDGSLPREKPAQPGPLVHFNRVSFSLWRKWPLPVWEA